MIDFVEALWVEERIDDRDILILDPRGWMKYLQGHLKGAVHLNAARLFDSDGGLLPSDHLAELFGNAGLGDLVTPVIYDSHDGQRGAMMAWALEYLGRADVRLMDTFFEGWKEQGHEVFYRPVQPSPREFTAQVTPGVRSTLDDVKNRGEAQLLDVRTTEEFTGQSDVDGRPGHIPGAVHLMWREFVGEAHEYLKPAATARERLGATGVSEDEPVIAYCRSGMRAAVSYLALQRLGYDVRLYDGSYSEWAASTMPVETSA